MKYIVFLTYYRELLKILTYLLYIYIIGFQLATCLFLFLLSFPHTFSFRQAPYLSGTLPAQVLLTNQLSMGERYPLFSFQTYPLNLWGRILFWLLLGDRLAWGYLFYEVATKHKYNTAIGSALYSRNTHFYNINKHQPL